MNAQQLILDEIERLENNLNLANLKDFLTRVSDGLKEDITITERQKTFILDQISWYNTVGEPRVDSGLGTQGLIDARKAHQRWLLCPNTVNSFVTTINSLAK